MITKFNIILLLIIVFSTNAFCCLSASQERIIPLGTSENCLIGIEIISNRHGEGESNSIPVWNHKIALKGFNKDYSDFLIKELSYKVSVPNEKSDSILRLEITKALQHCKILEGFEIFEPKEISFCDFQKDCSAISLVESNNRLEFRINSKNKSYPIQYLSSDYKGQMAKPYKSYFDSYFEDAIVGTDLKISSIRKYENKTHKILIFHLGTGQEFELASTGKFPVKKEYDFSHKFETIMDALFFEPVLHHGKGFDYFKMSLKN